MLNKIKKYLKLHNINEYNIDIKEDKYRIYNGSQGLYFRESYSYPNIFLVFKYVLGFYEIRALNFHSLCKTIYYRLSDLPIKSRVETNYFVVDANMISNVRNRVNISQFYSCLFDTCYIDDAFSFNLNEKELFIFEKDEHFFKFPNGNKYINFPICLTFSGEDFFKLKKFERDDIKVETVSLDSLYQKSIVYFYFTEDEFNDIISRKYININYFLYSKMNNFKWY